MGLIQRLTAEATALKGAWRTLRMTTPIAKNPTRVFPIVIEELAEKFGDAPALISARERLSYRELGERSNRYARWALSARIQPDDTVCLFIPTRPDYVPAWLGITKVGGVVSLINTNLRSAALAHCLDVVAPKHIIVASELSGEIRAALADVAGRPKIWSHGSEEFARIDRTIEKAKEAAAGTSIHVLQNESVRIGDVTFAGLVLLLLVAPLQVARRRRDRQRMRVMRAAEEMAETRAAFDVFRAGYHGNEGDDGPEGPPAPDEVV